MGRSFASIAVLVPLALLGACLDVAPTSSVPFQAAADRRTHYAAEITLAVKEDRRAELSEAAANGRMVLPQLPEIWGPPGAEQRRGEAPLALDLARLEPGAGSGPATLGCASTGSVAPSDVPPTECGPAWRHGAFMLPPFADPPILPALAPVVSGPSNHPSGPDPRLPD